MTRSLYLFMWSEMCPEEPGWNARSLRSDSIDGIESRDSKSTFLEETVGNLMFGKKSVVW